MFCSQTKQIIIVEIESHHLTQTCINEKGVVCRFSDSWLLSHKMLIVH